MLHKLEQTHVYEYLGIENHQSVGVQGMMVTRTAFEMYEIEGYYTKEELKEILKVEQQFYMEYAEENWLNRFFKIKAMSHKKQVPSITSVITDTPGGTNSNHSKTEQYALKSVEASANG